MCFMLRPYMIELRLPTYHHKRFFIAVVLFIVLAGLVKWCTTVALAADAQVSIGERVVTIHDGGEQTGLVTSAMTLREVLQQANVSINQNDITEPALDEPLVASSYEANIYRARPVVVKDGAKSVRIVTAYRTAKQITKQAGIILNDADIAQLRPAMDIAVEGAAEVLSIDRATPITFVFYGKTIQTSTRATTVDGLLEERKIATSKDDTTQPGLAAPIVAGMTVELWRNGKQVVTVDEDIAFTTRQVKDVNRERTYKEIQTPGENGKRTVTYEIEMRDGKEVARKETNAIITVPAVEQVEIIGAKVQVITGSCGEWMAAAGVPATDSVTYLINKESHCNPNAVNRSSGACGIGQALPCSKMGPVNSDGTSAVDPVAQLIWMNNYVLGRYGSWDAAAAHSRSVGWY